MVSAWILGNQICRYTRVGAMTHMKSHPETTTITTAIITALVVSIIPPREEGADDDLSATIGSIPSLSLSLSLYNSDEGVLSVFGMCVGEW